MRGVSILIVMVGALFLSGCGWFKGKPKAQAPPSPQAAPAATPTPGASRKPVPKPRRPVAERKPPKPAPVVVPEPPPPAEPKPASAQQLGQILSADDKARFRDMYQRSWAAARELLDSLSGRVLTDEQRDSAGRIQSFLKQAQETGASDWSAAAQLARRAEVLARDLLRVLQ